MRLTWRLLLLLGLAAIVLLVVIRARMDTPLFPAEALIALGVAAVVVMTPGARRTIERGIEALKGLSGRQRVWGAVIAGVVSMLIICGVRALQHQPFFILWHDEFQFHLQTQMVARFRLWMPPHPLVDFFDTFYVLIEPKYAAQSFPGAAMLFVPTVWLSLPLWVMPLLVSGAACALLWWILSELVDPAAATVGLLMLVTSWGFDKLATMYLAQVPVLMLGLVAMVAWIQYEKAGRRIWPALMGAAMGWAAITRPLDAVCYGVLLGIAMLLRFRKQPIGRSAIACGLILATAAPFLAIQLAFDRAVTGSFTKTPFQLYNERDQPALSYGGETGAARLPVSRVPQKQRFYQYFAMQYINKRNNPAVSSATWWLNNLDIAREMLGPLIVVLPIAGAGLMGLTTMRRRIVFGLLPAFGLAYHYYPIFIFHYVAFALPGLILLYALAPGALAAAVPRARKGCEAGLMIVMFCLCGAGVARAAKSPFVNGAMDEQKYIVDTIKRNVQAPAIVLFTEPPWENQIHLEPVYNDDVAWPDDAPIIRAHDLGPRNIELYRYYAQHAPARTVWQYNRTTGEITRLGNVADLAK